MPIYEYRCKSCQKTFEVIQKFSDTPLETCSECSGPLEKLVSRTSFHLKGGGWFTNDYGASQPKSGEKDGASPSKAAGKDDTKPASDSGDGTKPAGGCASGSCGCAH